jgi:WD40 repeat protein
MANVYLSYSSQDIEFARRLTADLQKSGLNFWMNWEGPPPTLEAWKETEKSIEESDVCLFLISPDSARSKLCGREIGCAVSNGKRLIPLLVRDIKEDEKPFQLRHLNWILFRESDDFDAAIKKLLTRILMDFDRAATHRRLQVQALAWERNYKASSFLLRGRDLQNAELQLATNSSNDPRPTDLQREYVFSSRRAYDRQGRNVRRNSMAGIIFLLALAAFGLVQANIAQTEQTNAEATLAAAKTAQASAESAGATAMIKEQEAKKQVVISRSQVLAVKSQVDNDNNALNLLLGIESFKLVSNFPHPDRIPAEQALLHSLKQVSGFQLSGHQDFIYTLAFSPDGRWLATGSYDNTTRLWDTQNLIAEPIILPGHNGVIAPLAFSPDGRWLATGSYDNIAHLWDMKNPASEPIILSGHDRLITTLAFSPDGRWLATGSYDKTVRLWDMKNPAAEPIVLRGPDGVISTLAFSPDGRWLASNLKLSDDNSIHVWGMKNLTEQSIALRGNDSLISALDFSPDGRWLATGSDDGTIRLWDMKRPSAEPMTLHSQDGRISTLAFSPDGRWLATGSSDTATRLWDMKNLAAEPITLRGPESRISALAFSPDGEWLATGGYDAVIRLWDMNQPTLEPIMLRGHKSLVTTLAFSPDGQWLAAGGYDAVVRLWDLNYDHILETACQVVGRNFTQAEWEKDFPNENYRKTCKQWPLETETVATQTGTP